jgi:hypothetical protein
MLCLSWPGARIAKGSPLEADRMGSLRGLGIFVIMTGVFGCAAVGAPDTDSEQGGTEKAEALAEGVIAVLAGTSGTITTLAHYSDGTPHPGNNAVDIGAPGGSLVWHQLDYLSARVAGGEVDVREVHESGYCSQWSPGDAYYNGSKIVVTTWVYDVDGAYLGKHVAAYQHVDPYYENMNATWTWNNAWAERPRYPEGAALTYGNGGDGGLFLGAVHSVEKPVYNGPNGYLCTDGSHLHQEGGGERARQRYVGEAITDRYHDLHYF